MRTWDTSDVVTHTVQTVHGHAHTCLNALCMPAYTLSLNAFYSLSLHLLMQARKHNSRHPNRLREVGYHKRLRQCLCLGVWSYMAGWTGIMVQLVRPHPLHNVCVSINREGITVIEKWRAPDYPQISVCACVCARLMISKASHNHPTMILSADSTSVCLTPICLFTYLYVSLSKYLSQLSVISHWFSLSPSLFVSFCFTWILQSQRAKSPLGLRLPLLFPRSW